MSILVHVDIILTVQVFKMNLPANQGSVLVIRTRV